jgi:ATPase family associated with various cellular activities (AAA)/ClpX C4-type zinc finger
MPTPQSAIQRCNMNALIVSDLRCQFCHNVADQSRRMVAGDSGAICSACVAKSQQLLLAGSGAQTVAESAPYLFALLDRHFAPEKLASLVVTSRTFQIRQQADLQLAIDELFGERHVGTNFVGVHSEYRHEAVAFARLIERKRSAMQAAPAQFEEVDVGNGATIRCLKNGVWLLSDADTPYCAVLATNEDYGQGPKLTLEIAAAGRSGIEMAEKVFAAIERRLSKDSCYRGRVLSLEQENQWSGRASRITVHELEPVSREEVILPETVLNAVERNVLQFASHRPALRKLGLSTQKGLLFHGVPGTGKTHCIRYLAGQLTGHTTLLITAEGVGLLPEYIALARLLQPALVVIEDADLIARARSDMNGACEEVMLNRLLNELDGLRERADIFFVLTTNRPDALEPALASRPGRIDQSIEFPLPDESHRMRLLRLYARGIPVDQPLLHDLATRTHGATPAFIKEFMRRIAQNYLEAGSPDHVTHAMAQEALHDMLFAGGVLNKKLLGGADVTAQEDA